MEPLKFIGKHAECLVYTDQVEANAIQQIYDFLNCPASEGMKLRFMPDIHGGAGCVIGFTGTMTDMIIPNLIGVDIGCGVISTKVYDPRVDVSHLPNLDFAMFDAFIRDHIPFGCRVRERPGKYFDSVLKENVKDVAIRTGQDVGYVNRSLGSLGGGNHFIEVGRDQNDCIWVTIHSGSRNFGLKVAKYHQLQAVPTVGKGRGLEWLEGEKANQYLHDMSVAQRFAKYNRSIMMNYLESFFGFRSNDTITIESVHNYINFQDRIIRKGAISAHKDELVIIPWNMRDGLIIGRGKGNADWNFSAPHGAGRLLGRRDAKRTFTKEQFEASMQGIWSSCIGESTVDEAPFVYKDHNVIMDQIKDTVDIEFTIKPLYNFKATE